jgi:hypothetical protein
MIERGRGDLVMRNRVLHAGKAFVFGKDVANALHIRYIIGK